MMLPLHHLSTFILSMKLSLGSSQKAYFASDFHLGIPNAQKSRERELKIIRWLDEKPTKRSLGDLHSRTHTGKKGAGHG